jgi:nucleoside-diphosphate-sugar epimerase
MMVIVWLAINEKYKIKICKCVMINAVQVNVIDNSISAVLPYIDLNSLDKKRLFITGVTGFFGLWLLSVLRILNQQKLSIEVCVLSRNPATFLSLYPQFRDQSWLSFISGDVKSFEIPKAQFDYVLHAATETSTSAHSNPIQLFDDIVIGTRQVLQLAQQCGVSRVLLISSGAVYGPQPSSVTHQPDESQLACSPLRTSSAYGEGKRVMELMGAMLHESTGIESISARCFAFCGPGLPLDEHFAIGNFVRDALYSEVITIQGNGSPMRSYLYGADLAVWLLNIMLHGQAGESYNVGSDEAISIKDLAFRVRDLLAPNKIVKVLQSDEPETVTRQYYVPEITRARKLGCAAWTSLDESLKMTAVYWQGQLIKV